MITCNVRNLQGPITGVQRYTQELLKRFANQVECLKPDKPLYGISGHLWEQFVLPHRLAGHLLWSPSNTGPITVERQIVSIMDVSPLDHPEWSSPKFSQWYRFLIPRLVNRVRGVLTISEFSKQRILHYCPEAQSKIHVTLLAADNRFREVDEKSVSLTKKKLGVPSPYYIVALGSLEPRKNLKTLLQAWKRLQTKLPREVWLVLAGAKGNRLVFREQSFEDLPPRVYLTGHVPDDDLPALYTGAMASVYLSFYEGFGLPPLEAMACGTPVLTANTSSLPEVTGDAALVVDPYDIESVEDGLIKLVEDAELRTALKYRGLERVKLFDWDLTAQKSWQVLIEAAQS